VPNVERMRTTLVRIRSAAEQMRRRVDELFLLAEAQAGERVRLDDDVELDGLVLECTDLMRGRASDLGRTLAIGRAEHVVVRGNEALLKEALVELLENGCRHGKDGSTVTVSSYAGTEIALLEVQSAGEPFGLPSRDGAQTPSGLGLQIVEWIARSHDGELRLSREGERNVLTVQLPVRQRTGESLSVAS
jgi:signal transduction histidine kinase